MAITNTNDRISKFKMQNGHQAIDNSQECLGHWNLGIGIWDFKPIMVVVDCFNLTGLFQPGRFPGAYLHILTNHLT